MTINQKKQSIVAVRLRLFPIRMLGKQRLLNNYYYLGRHPPSWNRQREKTGTLPNLTGWKLKTTGNFGNEFCDAI